MQLAVINIVSALAGNAAHASNATGASATSAASSDKFAQLLGQTAAKTSPTPTLMPSAKNASSDASRKSSASDAAGRAASTSTPKEAATSSAVTAQETAPEADAEPVVATREMSPEEAADALKTLDAQGATENPLLAKLKALLTAIKDSGEPQEVPAELSAEALQAMVQKMAALSQAVQAVPSVASEQQPEVAATDAPAEDAAASLEALMQELQAIMKKPTVEKREVAEAAPKPKKSTDEVAAIIPLNAVLMVQAPVAAATTKDVPAVSLSGSAAIPSLALPVTKEAQALPDVTLPGATETHPQAMDALTSLKAANDHTLNATLDAAKAALAVQDMSATPVVENSPVVAATTTQRVGETALATVAAAVDPQATPLPTATVRNAAPVNASAQSSSESAANTQIAAASNITMAAPAPVDNATTLAANAAATGGKLKEEPALDSKGDAPLNPVAVTGGAATTAAPHSAASAASVQAPVVVNHAPVTEQVHVAISRAAKDGIGQMTIQLDPIELGRVEVKLHTGADGQTQISFMVDKPSTLDALARGAHGLERSLQESGVKTDAGNMQFNLRQQPQTMDTSTGSGQRQAFNQTPEEEDATASSRTGSVAAISAATTRNYTVNIRDGLDIRA